MTQWIFCLLCITTVAQSQTTKQVLTGTWTVSDNEEREFTVDTPYGLDSYSALKIGGFLDDPLLDTHDTDYRWVANKNWTFTHVFRVNPDSRRGLVNELVWNELDTFCRVSINDILLDQVNNSFLYRSWHLGNYIRIGGVNILKLECTSTTQVVNQIAKSMKSPPPPDCWPSGFHGECHVNLVRSTQASFGWDWGPAFPIQGFWQPPQLIRSELGCRFGTGFRFFASISNGNNGSVRDFVIAPQTILWNAAVSVEVVFVPPMSDRLRSFCISYIVDDLIPKGGMQCFTRYRIMNKLDVPVNLLIRQSGVTPWWPNGIVTGPHTYRLQLKLITTKGTVLDQTEHTIGFRLFDVIEQPVKPEQLSLGLSFYFRVNGLPVFAKGANWIPSRLLPGRSSGHMRLVNDTLPLGFGSARQLLASAAVAGVNVIRIWGGGRYEPDSFYDEADRLGLMIWHDMMFAVSTYAKQDPG
ncbi:unnamed protein product [Echinostoma caproni]|uniref:Glyco_hydro_2 domain-containing protein n=1 Tax=Echinostoma caproni TaxID=27848 RepID=A0A183B6Y5_9TREM|nr:unnamed protein product [Echinostoma caproni]